MCKFNVAQSVLGYVRNNVQIRQQDKASKLFITLMHSFFRPGEGFPQLSSWDVREKAYVFLNFNVL